jgi:hypothetical protein
MAEPSTPLPPAQPQGSGSTVRVPESRQECIDVSLKLQEAVFAAYQASEWVSESPRARAHLFRQTHVPQR